MGRRKPEVPAEGKSTKMSLQIDVERDEHNTNVSGEGRTLSTRASCARVGIRGTPEGGQYEFIDEGIVRC